MPSTVPQILAVQNKGRSNSTNAYATIKTASGPGLWEMCTCFQGKCLLFYDMAPELSWALLVGTAKWGQWEHLNGDSGNI